MSDTPLPSHPFPHLTGSLAPIGPLPDDLRSAFNAAVFCATVTAETYRCLVDIPESKWANPGSLLDIPLELLARLKEHREAARSAILCVFNELTDVRQSLSPQQGIKAANAHWAALEMADHLRREIWKSADHDEWVQSLTNESVRMNPTAIADSCNTVCQHLRAINFPEVGTLLAEIQIEAARAAERRRLSDSETSYRESLVPEAEDNSAFRPASRFLTEADGPFPNYKAIDKALKENAWIRWRKPSSQRKEIHAGDWDRMLAKRQNLAGDPLDLPAEVVDRAVQEVEERKARTRARKGEK